MTTQPELPFDSFVGVGEPVPVAPEVPAETPEVPDEVPDVVADVAPVTEEAPATPAPAPVTPAPPTPALVTLKSPKSVALPVDAIVIY